MQLIKTTVLAIALLIPSLLWGEVNVYPTPSNSVGVVIGDAEGDWGILSQDFTSTITPHTFDGGKSCWFEAPPGRYAAIQSGGGKLRIVVVVLPGTIPTPTPPGPTPPGPTPPGPTPPNPPSPAPVVPPETGMHVVILEEQQLRHKLPPSQLGVLASVKLRDYLQSHTAVVNNWPTWRLLDVNTRFTANPEPWQTYLRQPTTALPWIIINSKKGYYSGPLPLTEQETLTLLQKYE